MKSLMMLVIAVLTAGCAGSLEGARPSLVGAAPSSERCQGLDSGHRNWNSSAVGSSIAAGGTGLASIPVESREAQIGLAAGAAAFAVWAGFSSTQSAGFSEAWARECTP